MRFQLGGIYTAVVVSEETFKDSDITSFAVMLFRDDIGEDAFSVSLLDIDNSTFSKPELVKKAIEREMRRRRYNLP